MSDEQHEQSVLCMCGERMQQIAYQRTDYRWACPQADDQNYSLHVPKPLPDLATVAQPLIDKVQPVAMAGRVVNINTHGEPTRTRLREIETSVSNGYEAECRELGWSRALQTTLRDLHFLLTFFRDDTANAAAPADNDAHGLRAK